MRKLAQRLVRVLALLGCRRARTIKVLPWNDHPAAVSLTFDDAQPVHLDLVVPELNKRHMHATFFVIVSKLTRIDLWRKVQAEGHEIGNHSVSHKHTTALNEDTEQLEVQDAKKFLDSNFGSNVIIFAYPYTETSKGLTFWVKKYDFAARGGPGHGDLLYVTPDSSPDFYNLPSLVARTELDASVYKSWVDKVVLMGAWMTLQIHGIGDPSTGWEPIPTDTFINLLDYLKQEEAKELWVAPFGDVAAYFRAQKIFEKATTSQQFGTFTWEIPSPFPQGVVLKAMTGKHSRLYQDGKELHPDKRGVYSVAFDARKLVALRLNPGER